MKHLAVLLVVVLAICLSTEAKPDRRAEWIKKWLGIIDKAKENPKLMSALTGDGTPRDDWMDEFPRFNCPRLEESQPPEDVHDLRPEDIEVVAAFGDSLTVGVGLGSENMLQLYDENRGESWCIGMEGTVEERVVTIPNLIKRYNPNIMGGSICTIEKTHPQTWLNRAQLMGISEDMEAQAQEMVDLMIEDAEIDIEQHWKLITMFIGVNDMCASCHDPERFSAQNFHDNIEAALDVLLAGSPRTLVQLVPVFDVSPLTNYSTGPVCDDMHMDFCDCAINEETRPGLKPLQMAYFSAMESLAWEDKYDQDDFTVVLQPHFVDFTPFRDEEGNWDTSFFAQDCFHLNRKGHQHIAYQLWNAMFIPVGQKPHAFDPAAEKAFICPTEENPFIYTRRNSGDDDNLGKKEQNKKYPKDMNPLRGHAEPGQNPVQHVDKPYKVNPSRGLGVPLHKPHLDIYPKKKAFRPAKPRQHETVAKPYKLNPLRGAGEPIQKPLPPDVLVPKKKPFRSPYEAHKVVKTVQGQKKPSLRQDPVLKPVHHKPAQSKEGRSHWTHGGAGVRTPFHFGRKTKE